MVVATVDANTRVYHAAPEVGHKEERGCDCLTGLCVRVGYGRSQELITPPPGRRENISRPTSFSLVQFSSGVLMLVGVWLGLLWVLFYFFDHCIQSSGVLPKRKTKQRLHAPDSFTRPPLAK